MDCGMMGGGAMSICWVLGILLVVVLVGVVCKWIKNSHESRGR